MDIFAYSQDFVKCLYFKEFMQFWRNGRRVHNPLSGIEHHDTGALFILKHQKHKKHMLEI